MTYWVYILECSNNSYYTGYTNDLLRRYKEHSKGSTKSKYTRAFKPVKLLKSWRFKDKSSALKFEHFVKSLSREKKEQLIKNNLKFS